MDTLENAELTTLIGPIARFLKSGTPIYCSKVQDTAGRKTKRTRTQAIAKRFAFYVNPPKKLCCFKKIFHSLSMTC